MIIAEQLLLLGRLPVLGGRWVDSTQEAGRWAGGGCIRSVGKASWKTGTLSQSLEGNRSSPGSGGSGWEGRVQERGRADVGRPLGSRPSPRLGLLVQVALLASYGSSGHLPRATCHPPAVFPLRCRRHPNTGFCIWCVTQTKPNHSNHSTRDLVLFPAAPLTSHTVPFGRRYSVITDQAKRQGRDCAKRHGQGLCAWTGGRGKS